MTFFDSLSRAAVRAMSAAVTLIVSVALVVGGLSGVAWAEDEKPADESSEAIATSQDSDGDGQADAPDAVSAGVMAKITKKSVEDLSQRTETDMVLANPDGSFTSKAFMAPVRVLQDEQWVDVDYDLVKGADGSWAPKASPVDATIDGGGDAEAARVTFDDGQSLAVTWPEVLPEPTVEGGVATYKVSDSSDLVVSVTSGGLNAHIRLNEAPAVGDPVLADGAFELGLQSEDLKVKENSAGGLKLVDADDGKTVGSTSQLVAWDAKTDDSGSPAEVVPLDASLGAASTTGDVTTQPLELKTPAGYLSDPDTQYPVIIDPSIVNLTKLRDLWVRSGDGGYYQNDNNLVVGKINGSNNTNAGRSFLKFHTGPLGGKTVINATLGLWQYYAYSCTARTMYVNPVTTAWDGGMRWTNQPTAIASGGSYVNANRGAAGCGDGFTTVDVTGMVGGWASGAIPNEGIRLQAGDETVSAFERRFCSMDTVAGTSCDTAARIPYLQVNYNTPPYPPVAPVVAGMMRADGFWANSITPSIATVSVDSDDVPDNQSHYIRVAPNVQIPFSSGPHPFTTLAACYTPWVPAGAWAGCIVSPSLTNGQTYWATAVARDAPAGSPLTPSATGAPWTKFQVDGTTPPAPTVSCTGPYANNSWTISRTVTSISCTATSSGAFDMIFNLNKSNTPEIVLGASVTKTVNVPLNGVVAMDFSGRSKSGNIMSSSYTFGIGASSILPVEEERTSTTVPMLAESETGALSAKLQWRLAGAADSAWVDATKTGTEFDNIRVAGTNAKWTGAVQSSSIKSRVDLVWSPNAEPNVTAPSHLESRIVFAYQNNLLMETPARSVQVVPHAFGGSFPSQDLGPGQVALFTGEFQLSETDVDVPAYSGSLTLGRSHLSLGGATSGPAGVFGPGWSADFAGPDFGVANYSVDDRRAADGSIYVTSPDGESYGYGKDDGSVGANVAGTFKGLGEYAVDEDYLSVNTAGTELKMVEADGTVTTFTKTGTTWLAQEVISAEANSTVTYAYDGMNVSWIFAPKPGGVTSCNTTAQTPGCRALELIYTTVDGKTRVDEVRLHIWNPRPGADGKPGATAGMDTVTVAKYSYTTDGKLTAAWDPRADTGSASLKTEYTYDTVNSKTVVKTVTEPGLKPWTINYDDKGRVKTITRAQDADVVAAAGAGSGPATWTVQYGIGLSAGSDGLPNMSPEATATWGQPELDAPYGGAAVFGPDQVPDATPTASQYLYASVSYWTKSGRTSNTAAYGAGAWQIDSTRYDDKGNPVWQLSPAGKAKVLEEFTANAGAGQAEAVRQAASKYATLTTYTTGDERRVTATYGPTSTIRAQDSNAPTGAFEGRKLTRTVYDDTASAALKPGYPTENVPAGGFGLPVETTERVTTGVFPYDAGSSGAPTEYDVDTTRYTYDPVVTGDGNGWVLKSPTRVKVKTGTDTWATTLTRFDTEGKVIETRTPEGTETTDGAGSDSRSTKTTYYTVGTNNADTLCGNAPAWAGLVCKTAPAGGNAPTTRVTGYSAFLAPTRTEEIQDGASRIGLTTYDTAGRSKTSTTTTAGLAATDRTVSPVTTNYSPTTGLVTGITDGTKTQATTYDTWGRKRTAADGVGSTSTTTYDAAGRVHSANDGKATYAYNYNGTDSRSKTERRGLVTSVDVGTPGGVVGLGASTLTGAYDETGALTEQKYPGGVTATWVRDINGVETGLEYKNSDGVSLLSYANTVDADGRVATQTGGGSSQDFTYDKRDRLTQVKDTRGGQCTTRKYAFTGDSNRTSLTNYGPGSGGACQTTTGTPVTSTFNADDQLGGDAYDKLGRTAILNSGTGGTSTIDYHANDMVAMITQGTKSQDYTLDLAGRVSATKNLTSGVSLAESTNYYDGSDDSPAWTFTKTRPNASTAWTEAWDRNVADLTGDLGLIQKSTGTTVVQLANLHGDVAATYTLGATPTFTMATAVDEYGKPLGTPDGARYGWLGTKQRDATALAGLTLMGLRLYATRSGRFLSRDAVHGGNDNPYTYPADPVNSTDLSGACPVCLIVAPIAAGAARAGTKYVAKKVVKKVSKETTKKVGRKPSTKAGDRGAKNSGKAYPSKTEAENAAKNYANGRKSCEYRGACSSRDHVHVDKVDKTGRKTHTRHYYYPAKPTSRLPKN